MYTYSSDQFMFDRILAGLAFTVKFLWKLLLYSPLWFTAYIFCTYILDNDAGGLVWLGVILLFSFSLYQAMFFLKGIIIGFKTSGKMIWLPLSIICIFFTSILPVWLMFNDIHELMLNVYAAQADMLTWFAAGALTTMMYSRYHFLTDMSPTFTFPIYQFGLSITS